MPDDGVTIGPVRLARMTAAQARDAINAALEAHDGASAPLCVAFCNAHTAKLAFDQPAFAETLRSMLVLNDGVGIDLAARALGYGPFPDNLNGTDFVPAFLRDSPRPLSVFLLGAKPDILRRAESVIAQRYPQHRLVGVQDGYFADIDLPVIADAIAARAPDLVLCAMGNPRQEMVIATLAARNAARVLMGVGALFDFLADAVPRAPPWIRRLRMEFLYRLAQEPRRLGRRYTIEILEFLAAIAKLRLSGEAPKNG